MKANVYIVGSKGIPAKYGGFETFVENLTKRKVNSDIKYHVFGFGPKAEEYEYNNCHCINIQIKKDNAYNRIFAVSKALARIEKTISNKGENNVVYVLGCRVGLVIRKHYKRLRKLNCPLVFNPDGLEWKRSKWNALAKLAVKTSEKRMIKHSDFLICDSIGIRDYILSTYKFDENKVEYIAYGSDIHKSNSTDDQLCEYLNRFNTKPNDYYLMVGRFVPENNYESIIREFMKSNSTKKLLIISNVEENKFYNQLRSNLHFEDDSRIIFAGTLYDDNLLKKIRENAFAYLHGHSVGGTNPSLLEALSSTKVNLLYDVPFNREVGEDQCLYFNDKDNDLSSLINNVETDYSEFSNSFKSIEIIKNRFSWDLIIDKYEKTFLKLVKNNSK